MMTMISMTMTMMMTNMTMFVSQYARRVARQHARKHQRSFTIGCEGEETEGEGAFDIYNTSGKD